MAGCSGEIMKISFEYNKTANTINALCPKVLTTEAFRNYFKDITLKKSDINKAYEVVDFTNVEKFASTYQELYDTMPLLKTLAKEKTVVKTTFKVRNPYQYGMARMLCSIFSFAGANCSVDYQNGKPD